MNMTKWLFSLLCTSLLFCFACVDDDGSGMDDDMMSMDDLTDITYDPQPYNLEVPCGFPDMEIPADNPLTVDGVELGRFLFYDPILSADSSMSCATCHLPSGNFTDNLDVSTGIDGVAGTRSSMSLLNVGYFYEGLFWDGRVTTLEEQALLPVEDPIELHTTWPEVETKLKRSEIYPTMFRKAFGIESKEEITKFLAAKAIAQFERSLVSSGESKFDRSRCEPGVFLSPLELEGFELFTFEENEHPGCTHCHKTINQLFTDNTFANNGLTDVGGTDIEDLNNFPDKGLGEVTGNILDNGKFRTPSLRNIFYSAPYMHNGQFQTLEEVIDHYSSGGFSAANTNPNIQPFPLTGQEKEALIAFLRSLDDEAFMTDPKYQNPFQ